MEIIVHRGTCQIGGCCTEIRTDRTRILIDFGKSLPDGDARHLAVPGVTDKTLTCNAVFLTHYHGDHIGELNAVPNDIPIYMGKVSKKIEEAYQRHMGTHYANGLIDFNKIHELMDFDKVIVNEITVTAIPSDHSAFGSYMYLIEANGQRILHTGDYRLHGPRRERLKSILSNIGSIDLLITEATTVDRLDGGGYDEKKVEEVCRDLMGRFKYCFVLCSSGNIDRIASVAKAIPHGKYFLVDAFQKELLTIANEDDPAYECDFAKALTIGENLKDKMTTRGFCLVSRVNPATKQILEYYASMSPNEVCIIYSMWSGYLAQKSISDFCALSNNFYHAHTSGHVLLQDMNEMINRMLPKRILFIHTESKADNIPIDLRSRIVKIDDGEVYRI